MAEVLVKCRNCGEEILVDTETQIGVCPKCKASYVTQDLIEKEDVELSEEEIAFLEEEGIEFKETLTEEDIYNFNNYILSKSSSNLVSRIIFILLGLIVCVLPAFAQNYYWIIFLGSFLIIYGAFLYMPLQRKIVKKNLKAKKIQNLYISVKVGTEHVQYKLVSEKSAPLIKIKDITKAVNKKDYIYLHINAYTIVIIKLIDNDKKEEITEKIKEIFVPIKKYKEK